MEQSTLLSELEALQAKHIVILEHFMTLNESELTRRPSSGGWNILECVAHMNIYASFYNEEFRRQIDSGKARTNEDYRPGYLGSRSAESMLPDTEGKLSLPMPTLKKMNPQGKDVDHSVIAHFLDKEKNLLNLLGEMEGIDLNLNKCKLTIPVLQFRLGDTLRFHIYHNERHFQQANRLLT